MSLTHQNIDLLSGLITSQIPSPNPEEANFETIVGQTQSQMVESTRSSVNQVSVNPHHSSQMTDQYPSGLLRSSTYNPDQIDNVVENSNSNTITQSNI